MAAKGFTGKSLPLVPGTLYGLRAFNVDTEEACVRGVSYPERWVGGENKATCHYPFKKHFPHSMVDCDHGYWSYFGTENQFMSPGRAAAVVEGYGEVVIGEDGFRSEKARIKAVVFPTSDILFGAKKVKSIIGLFLSLIVLYVGVIAMPFIAFTTLQDFMAKSQENFVFGVLLSIGALAIGLFSAGSVLFTGPALLWDYFQQRKDYKDFTNKAPHSKIAFRKKTREKLNQEFMRGFSENYPDTKIYTSLDDMLNEYGDFISQQGRIAGNLQGMRDEQPDSK